MRSETANQRPGSISLLLAVLLFHGLSSLICGFTDRRELQAVSENEIEAILSHRNLTLGGERYPYEMKIWAGPETPEGFQHLLFLVERRKDGQAAYRLACDDLYRPSPEGGSPVMKSRDCYQDRRADGSIDGELHQVGNQAGKLQDSAFHRFIGGKDPEKSMKFSSASKKAEEGYRSILRRMLVGEVEAE